MTPILFRYTLRRWLFPIGGAVMFYGGLVLAKELVGISRDVFSLGASFKWLLPLLMLAIPEVLMLVLPMASVLGGLLGTQQMVQSSEMVASHGLGIGSRMLYRPYALLSVLLLLITGMNSHFLIPSMNHLQSNVRAQMLEEARTRFLRTGQAPKVPPGAPDQSVWMAPNGEVHVMEVSSNGIQHMVAKSIAYYIQPQEDGGHLLDMHLKQLDGSLFRIQTESVVNLHQESQDLRFHLPGTAKFMVATPLRYLQTFELLKLKSPSVNVELSRRFSLPIASIALLLIGIALGLGHPRFQGGGSILKSLGVILIYYFINMLIENFISQSIPGAFLASLLMPWLILFAGVWLISKKLNPHISNTYIEKLKREIQPTFNTLNKTIEKYWTAIKYKLGFWGTLAPKKQSTAILNRWACSLWVGSWGATLGTLLVLDLLIEYATLAGDISRNHKNIFDFLQYWILNLPTFMNTALPITFLLGTLFALAQMTQTAEWVALRAGGVSLAQLVWSSRKAWMSVLGVTILLQVWIAPIAYSNADIIYRKLINRPPITTTPNSWLYLGSTGVLWNQQGQTRWGFPLTPPREAPILLRWETGDAFSFGLPWGGMKFVQGPPAETLFPEAAQREPIHADMSSTKDLVRWQRWAPDPNRATLLWARILSWLAGPCLVLAMLSWAFPPLRSGRGQSLGKGLVGGLLYLGLEGIFLGAAKSGEIPAILGVLAPMLFFAGYGFLRLRQLRT